MEEIGNLLELTRESAGVSLKEVSEDLSIDEMVLENIEDGKAGSFSDVFVLKDYIFNYAKYLGLDAEKIVDEFNEYVFESTSKIPIKDIEKEIAKNIKNEEENKVISPYTKKESPKGNGLYLFIYITVVILVILAVVWSVKQITINTTTAKNISYVERKN